jgi:hypothetical protein
MKRLSFVLLAAPFVAVIACSSSNSGTTAPAADAGPDTAPSGSQCTAAYKDLLLPIEKVSTGTVSVIATNGDTKTLFVDASAGGLPNAPKNPRVYINLESGARVDLTDGAAHDSTDWDLAIKRDVIFTNGGDGGPGQGGAVSVEKAFASVTAADGAAIAAESFFDSDCNAKKDPTGAVQTTFSDWYDYDQVTHIPSPKANHTYVVSSASGVKYKVAITSYNGLADGGTGTTYANYLLQVAPL